MEDHKTVDLSCWEIVVPLADERNVSPDWRVRPEVVEDDMIVEVSMLNLILDRVVLEGWPRSKGSSN